MKNKTTFLLCLLRKHFLVFSLFTALIHVPVALAAVHFASQTNEEAKLPFSSEFVNGDALIITRPSETVTAHFVFKNNGQEKWGSVESKNPVFLGVHNSKNFYDFSQKFRNWGWSNEFRIRMTEQYFDEKVGAFVAVFGCEMTAPEIPGEYSNVLQLIVEGDEYTGFFGDSVELVFKVEKPLEKDQEQVDDLNSIVNTYDPVASENATGEDLDLQSHTVSGEIERVIEAKNEISNYEKELENRLKKLEEFSHEIQDEMKNAITEDERSKILHEIEKARQEKERLSGQLKILQKKIENNNKLLAADIKGSIDRSPDNGVYTKSDLPKVIIFSSVVFFLAFFGFEYLFSRHHQKGKSAKNE